MTLAATSAGSASALARMAGANELVKQVLRVSSSINLVAINAMLASRSAGSAARGFGVVSAELRSLSHNLDRDMTQMVTRFAGLVSGTAGQIKVRRRQALLERADRGGELAARAPGLLAQRREALQAMDNRLGEVRHALRGQIRQAMRVCKTGYAMARSARIESVYGGDKAQVMTLVAVQVEEALDGIMVTLAEIQQEMEH